MRNTRKPQTVDVESIRNHLEDSMPSHRQARTLAEANAIYAAEHVPIWIADTAEVAISSRLLGTDAVRFQAIVDEPAFDGAAWSGIDAAAVKIRDWTKSLVGDAGWEWLERIDLDSVSWVTILVESLEERNARAGRPRAAGLLSVLP
jgi:hypothetical protein